MVASNAGNINPWFSPTEKIKIGRMIINLYFFSGTIKLNFTRNVSQRKEM